MSRTRKGSKPGGFEFWSKRPGNFARGRYAKTITHRIERRDSKSECREQLAKS